MTATDAKQRTLRLNLTDGHGNISALEDSTIKDISLKTAPGSKLLLKGSIPVERGFVMLTNDNCKLLGGLVPKLVEKWKAQDEEYSVLMSDQRGGRGAPPWVPFGRRIQSDQQYATNFKSLGSKAVEGEEENSEFLSTRQAHIAEAQASGTATKFEESATKISIPPPKPATTPRLHTNSVSETAATKTVESKNDKTRDKKLKDVSSFLEASSAADPEMRPSGPTTLFDFLSPKMAIPKPNPGNDSGPTDNRNGYMDDRSYKPAFDQNKNSFRRGGGSNRAMDNRPPRQVNSSDRPPPKQFNHAPAPRQHASASAPREYGSAPRQTREYGSAPRQNPSAPRQNPSAPREYGSAPRQNPSVPRQNPSVPRQTREYGSAPRQNPSAPRQYASSPRQSGCAPSNCPRNENMNHPPPGFSQSNFPSLGTSPNPITASGSLKWRSGSVCMAPYPDGRMYAAVVMAVAPSGFATVKYRDYEEIENVPTRALLPMQTNAQENSFSFNNKTTTFTNRQHQRRF